MYYTLSSVCLSGEERAVESEHSMQNHQGKTVALPEEARQQVVGYLKHQASKSTPELLALVDRAADVRRRV
jgi:hypothetical protein